MAGGNGSDRMDRIEKALDRLTERHQALTDRHEALAQTVELIAGMQRAGEERMAKTEALMARSLEAINALARIAESHERRLDDLEGGR